MTRHIQTASNPINKQTERRTGNQQHSITEATEGNWMKPRGGGGGGGGGGQGTVPRTPTRTGEAHNTFWETRRPQGRITSTQPGPRHGHRSGITSDTGTGPRRTGLRNKQPGTQEQATRTHQNKKRHFTPMTLSHGTRSHRSGYACLCFLPSLRAGPLGQWHFHLELIKRSTHRKKRQLSE